MKFCRKYWRNCAARRDFDAEQGFTKGANEDGDKAVLEGLVTRRGEEAALFARGHHTGGMIQRNPYPYNPRPI